MNILFLNFLFCLFIAGAISTSHLVNSQKNRLFLSFSFWPLLIVHAMVPYESVPDLPAYETMFYDLEKLPWVDCFEENATGIKMEIGYQLVMKFFSEIYNNFRFFLIVYSIVLLQLYYSVIKRYSPYVVLSVLLFLVLTFNQSIFVIRQHISVAICFATFPFILNKKFKPFLLCLIIAFLLHKSALIFLPIYFIYNLYEDRFWRYAIISASGLLMISYAIIMSVIESLGFAGYVENKEPGNAIPFIISLFFLLIYILSLKKSIYERGINRLLFILLAIYVVVCALSMLAAIGRIQSYFSIALILAIPKACLYTRKRFYRVMIIMSSMSIWFYIAFLGSAYEYISAYKTIF